MVKEIHAPAQDETTLSKPRAQRKRRSKRIAQPESEDGEVMPDVEVKEETNKSSVRQVVRGRKKKARRDDSQYVTGRWLEEEHQLFLIGKMLAFVVLEV